MQPPSAEVETRLRSEQNIWFGSVRPDGRPHLAPVWFVYHEGKLYIGTDPRSVKARNIEQNPNAVLALEGGEHPVICEGTARMLPHPYPPDLKAAFFQKYEWDLDKEVQFEQVVEITPAKWLAW